MKKLFIVIVMMLTCMDGLAQNQDIEFMGMPLCGNDTTAFCSLLRDKNYVPIGEKDGSILFRGIFNNLAAEAMVVPFDGSDKINAIIIFLNDLNPIKMGSLYTELLQKFMAKYQNYKYDTSVDSKGGTTSSFRSNIGFVALHSGVSGTGKCQISIYYSCSKEKSKGNNEKNKGIEIDDL